MHDAVGHALSAVTPSNGPTPTS
ncbi:hypothetical protein ACTVZO_10740 [Streptomyces sp. IBSNAI002]